MRALYHCWFLPPTSSCYKRKWYQILIIYIKRTLLSATVSTTLPLWLFLLLKEESLASQGSRVPAACLFTRGEEGPTGFSGEGKAFFASSRDLISVSGTQSGPRPSWRAMCKASTKQCFQRPSVRAE